MVSENKYVISSYVMYYIRQRTCKILCILSLRIRQIFCKHVKSQNTVKLGNKERFDKEQIGIKEPFPVTNLPFTS